MRKPILGAILGPGGAKLAESQTEWKTVKIEKKAWEKARRAAFDAGKPLQRWITEAAEAAAGAGVER